MTKTVLMVLGLAGVFAVGTACFGLGASRASRTEATTVEACAGLSGDAKVDCERRHAQ